MEEALGVTFVCGILLLLFGGAVSGIVASFRHKRVAKRLVEIQNDLAVLKRRTTDLEKSAMKPRFAETEAAQAHAEPVAPAEKPVVPVEEPTTTEFPAKKTVPPPLPTKSTAKFPTPEEKKKEPVLVQAAFSDKAPAPSRAPSLGLEHTLGSKWFVWVGVVLMLIGGAYFLKYAYDNGWIGPKGRLAIGTLASLIALGFGQWFQKKQWNALFQGLTGCGLGGLYGCVFFSMKVYNLASPSLAMTLAILVTGLAVVLSVAHRALPIAILAMVGGFLSPVLLSTGANHPYALFIYIFILDLVALGAAYYRRWRELDILAFIGTIMIYQGWFHRFYHAPDEPSQMLPALLFTSLFYLLFLAIPMFYSLVRRLPERVDGIALLALNAVHSFYCYYQVLFQEHRELLALTALLQALLIFFLFRLTAQRSKNDRMTMESLLVIGLALVILAVPIQLRLYAVALAWAAEAWLFVYLGLRFKRVSLRVGGALVFFLSTGWLLARLPLHHVLFNPVFNVPFASWAAAIAAIASAAYLLNRDRESKDSRLLAAVCFALAFSLACLALTLEVSLFWKIYRPEGFRYHEMTALVLLWTAISALSARFLLTRRDEFFNIVAYCVYAIGGCVWLAAFEQYDILSRNLFANSVFPARFLFIASLWLGAQILARRGVETQRHFLSLLGHVGLVALIAVELIRWSGCTELVPERMALSFISAAWALHALGLVAGGLLWRNRPLRYLGFGLFALTIAKVFLVDTTNLEKVYRILSFFSTGLFLVIAGYFYQRFGALLLEENTEEKEEVVS